VSEDSEWARLQGKEIVGGLSAVTFSFSAKGTPLHCMLVFTRNVMIVAFLGKRTQVLATLSTPRYGPMKKWLERQAHKPASTILTKYKSWIITYSAIMEMETTERGRIRKSSYLRILTKEKTHVFGFATDRTTLDGDITSLFNKAGLKHDKVLIKHQKKTD